MKILIACFFLGLTLGPPAPRPLGPPVPFAFMPPHARPAVPPLLGLMPPVPPTRASVPPSAATQLALMPSGPVGTTPVRVPHFPTAVGHFIGHHTGDSSLPVATATAVGTLRGPRTGGELAVIRLVGDPSPDADATLDFPEVPAHALPNAIVPTHALPDIGQHTRGRSASPRARRHHRVVSSDENLRDLGDSTPRRSGSAGQRLSSFEQERKEKFQRKAPISRPSREAVSSTIRQFRRERSTSKKRGVRFEHGTKQPGKLKPPPPPPPPPAVDQVPPPPVEAVSPAPPLEDISRRPAGDSDSETSTITSDGIFRTIEDVEADISHHVQGFATLQEELRGDSDQAALDDDDGKKPAAREPALAPTTETTSPALVPTTETTSPAVVPPLPFAARGTDNTGDDDDMDVTSFATNDFFSL